MSEKQTTVQKITATLQALHIAYTKESAAKDARIAALEEALTQRNVEFFTVSKRMRAAESRLSVRETRLAEWKQKASEYRNHMGRYQRELADCRRVLRNTKV